MTSRRPLPRRRYLTSAAVLGVAPLAGCLDGRFESDGRDDDSVDRIDRNGDGADGAEDPGSDDTGKPPADADDDCDETTDRSGDDTDESDDGTETIHADYETTCVRAVTPDGDELGSVTAAIADTRELRYLGLSDTESLPEDRGMLFVFDDEDDRRFVMREMDFGIDIVYADADGVITAIHHAPEPGPGEDGEQQRYPGHGRYVLEVVYEWTADRGVETGDVLEFEL